MSTATPSALVPKLASLPSGHIPSPDPEDHLTLKKLKISHPQETTSQPRIIVQIPTQPILSQSVNINSNLPRFTIPSTIPTSLPDIVNIEDSDEDQGFQTLQTNIFSKIISPPKQATVRPSLSEAELPIQPTIKQLITHTTIVQLEQIIAEHTTNVALEQPLTEQPIVEQNTEQSIAKQVTVSSATIPEPSSTKQQTGPATTIEDLPEIEDLPSTPSASQDEG